MALPFPLAAVPVHLLSRGRVLLLCRLWRVPLDQKQGQKLESSLSLECRI